MGRRRHSFVLLCFHFISHTALVRDYINGRETRQDSSSPLRSPPHSHIMAPIAFGSSAERHTPLNALKKLDHEKLDGFGTRAVHIGSDPDPSTGAVIPAISLSTTYKQNGVGNHKVSESDHYVEISSGTQFFFAVLGI